jgi:hypothetical protein
MNEMCDWFNEGAGERGCWLVSSSMFDFTKLYQMNLFSLIKSKRETFFQLLKIDVF